MRLSPHALNGGEPGSGGGNLDGGSDGGMSCDSELQVGRVSSASVSGGLLLQSLGVEGDAMIDGELQLGDAAFKQSELLCFAKGSHAPSASSGLAPVSCSHGVCENTGKLPVVQNCPSNPWSSRNTTWLKPCVVPLPSSKALGCCSFEDGTATLDEEEVEATLKKFDNALVGRLFGRRIPYHQLTGELTRKWAAFGRFRLVTLSGDCFVCFFDSLEACNAVLMGGPWVLFGQVLGVDKWTTSFSPSSLEGFCTPVWIRMPGLPLYCWSPTNIGRIVSLVGEPLWMDSATDQIEKGIFARACVRIDLSKPLKAGIWVQGRHGKFFQSLVYEGLSIFCFRCGQVGHKENVCKMPASCRVQTQATSSPSSGSGRTPKVGPDGSVVSTQVHDGLTEEIAQATSDAQKVIPRTDGPQLDDRGAGPWMLVQRKKISPKATLPGYRRGPSPGQKTVGDSRGHGKPTPLANSLPHRSSSGYGVELLPSVSSRPIFSGFSALAEGTMARSSRTVKAQLARASRSSKERMVSDLGPVVQGARKRRKAHSLTDGGDASPSPTP